MMKRVPFRLAKHSVLALVDHTPGELCELIQLTNSD